MTRHPHDLRFSSPAVERARARAEERERQRLSGSTGRVHGERVDLDVMLEEITEGQPVEVKETLPQAWVGALVDDQREIRWSAGGDGAVDVSLEREAAFVRMKGSARFSLVHPCVRCGQRDVPFDVPLRLDLRLVERAPIKDAHSVDADYSAHDDGDDHAGSPLGDAADLEDLDVASYEGDRVAVDAVLREQLFLELPAHPHCGSPGACLKESCGLAEQQQAIDAERARFVDPRWTGALQQLKATLPTSGVVAAADVDASDDESAAEPVILPSTPAAMRKDVTLADDATRLPACPPAMRKAPAEEVVLPLARPAMRKAPPTSATEPATAGKKATRTSGKKTKKTRMTAAKKKGTATKPKAGTKTTRNGPAARKTKNATMKPAQKKPAQKKPAQKKPAQKKPAQKKPAQKKPAQKKPAQKKATKR